MWIEPSKQCRHRCHFSACQPSEGLRRPPAPLERNPQGPRPSPSRHESSKSPPQRRGFRSQSSLPGACLGQAT